MKTRFVMLLSLAFLAGCASLTKSSFAKRAEAQGISAADIEAVDKQSAVYYGDYQRTSNQKFGVNPQMLQTQITAQTTKITGIFCACVKKLGEKCQGNPAGLSGADKDVWVKGNGAAEALSLIQRSPVDALSCG
ncbi:MAG TPA: hypothetical protein PL182_11925 [Pseudobdellovibrionaceae bacterium]|nr:hypothetical protein [Pseudobdellovibrionaceae bacterium]